MKEFRDELLDYLMNQSGFVSLVTLKDKHCPNPSIFKLEDQDLFIKCRVNMNHILRELKTMGWIDTTGEFGTGTGYPNIEGMRYFILDPDIKARMTTKGEMEYKKLKREELPTNNANIGTFAGVFIQGSSISETDFRPEIKPITNPPNVPTKPETKQGIMTRIGKFIMRNIIAIIVSTVSALIAGYLIWRFGWLN